MSVKTIYIYLCSVQVNKKYQLGELRAIFVQHFPGIPGTYPSRCTHDYAHGAPGPGIPAPVTRHLTSAPQKLWSAPQMPHPTPRKFWSAVQMLWSSPQKLWSAAQMLWSAAQMLWSAVQMLWSAPRKLYRAVQMLCPALRKLYFAVQMCFIAVQMCIEAAQMFFMGVREYSISAPVLSKYMPIRRGGPYPRGFSVNPRQKSL